VSRILADNGLPGLDHVPLWFNDPANWSGPDGLVARIREHLTYSAVILVLAILVALPLGLFIGHTGRGVVLVAGVANGLRAVPTLGFVLLLYVWLSPKIHSQVEIPYLVQRGALGSFVAMVVVLVLLAIPPILTNTYAGVQAIDPAVRDAAAGMGMGGGQVVRQVEFPCALPLILSGIRSATLQVVATVTVAAFVPLLGGLGRYIADGAQSLQSPRYGYPAMVAAGLVVAVLAMVIDGLLSVLQRFVVSPGLSGRYPRRQLGVTTGAAVEASLAKA
jgi:osmoprotectant transport system permease protein